MKVVWDKKGNPRIELDKEELKEQSLILSDAVEIRKLLASNGWKILTRWFERGEKGIIEDGTKNISLKSKVDLSPYQWAILKGFSLCINIPEQILAKADIIEANRKEEAKLNASPEDDE